MGGGPEFISKVGHGSLTQPPGDHPVRSGPTSPAALGPAPRRSSARVDPHRRSTSLTAGTHRLGPPRRAPRRTDPGGTGGAWRGRAAQSERPGRARPPGFAGDVSVRTERTGPSAAMSASLPQFVGGRARRPGRERAKLCSRVPAAERVPSSPRGKSMRQFSRDNI